MSLTIMRKLETFYSINDKILLFYVYKRYFCTKYTTYCS